MANTIAVSVIGDVKDINNKLGNVEQQLSGFGKTIGKVGGLLKGAFAVAVGGEVLGQLKGIVDAGSDLNETISKSNTVFGSASKDIEAFANTAAKSMGLSKQEALAGMAQFGNLFDQLKIGKPAAADMAKGFATMSADLASFNNLEPAQVMEAFTSATRGEFDALQAVIPTINAAAIETEALAQTHKKSAKELTEADKVNALYALSVKGMGKAQGDFKRTSQGAANQQRIFNAEMKNAKAAVGSALLPIMTKLMLFINGTAVPAMKQLVTNVTPLAQAVGGKLKEGFAAILPIIVSLGGFITGTLVPAFASVVGFVRENAELFKTLAVAIGAMVLAYQAYQGALAIVSAVTKAYTAVQAALNLVMSLNPIGALVLLIVGLVAAFVYLWKTNDGFRNALISAWNAIKNAVSTAVSFVVGFVKKNWPLLLALITGPIGLALAGIIKHWDSIKRATSTAIGAIKTAVTSGFSTVLTAIVSAWKSIVTGVTNQISAVVRLHQGIKAKVTGAISGASRWLYQIGKDIVQGLINGIGDRAGALIDKARGLANSVKNTISGALKIGSPSKVMRDIGRWTGRGFANGLRDSIGWVKVASTKLAVTSARYSANAYTGQRSWAGTRVVASPNATASPIYNITVNAPVGSSPATIGKEIIKNIKAHEEIAGPRWRQ